MEVLYRSVLAEKTMDGRIIYRGKQKRKSLRFLLGAMAVLAAISIFLVWLVDCPQNACANDVVTCTPAQIESYERAAKVVAELGYKNRVQYENDSEAKADESLIEPLALVIYQESGGDACSDDTRRMVGEVAMNRVSDSRFPDTLEEVLLQKQQYGRLYWTGLVWPERASLPEEAHAVQRAYDIAEQVLTSDERLLPVDVVFQAEFKQGVETVAEADGFYFCR